MSQPSSAPTRFTVVAGRQPAPHTEADATVLVLARRAHTALTGIRRAHELGKRSAADLAAATAAYDAAHEAARALGYSAEAITGYTPIGVADSRSPGAQGRRSQFRVIG